MAKFIKENKGELPQMNTSSLPDIVFIISTAKSWLPIFISVRRPCSTRKNMVRIPVSS